MQLVYLEGAKEPYTTSEIIAECAQVKHDTVQALIRSHQKDLGTFGVNGFEIRKPPKGTSPGEAGAQGTNPGYQRMATRQPP